MKVRDLAEEQNRPGRIRETVAFDLSQADQRRRELDTLIKPLED
jgi:hypothetical protein